MNFYLKKYGFQPKSINTIPQSNLGLIIVIPCFNEPDILTTLHSLNNCKTPNMGVEILIIINAGIHHESFIKVQNKNTSTAIQEWKTNTNLNFDFHVIEANDLPKKHAGVGLARKIGMDEAVSRFDQIGHDGIIACFDADSTCESNYLTALETHFLTHPKTPGCAIPYAHPVDGDHFDEKIYAGIIYYELFLRYYNQGLHFCELPFAYHTVGSSMAIKSSAYQKQGGMNKRKAGEDFYFLHKIISLGYFTELNSALVIPSPRTSDRVPFGTGKAINDWINTDEETYLTYDFRIWEILKNFVSIIPLLQEKDLKDLDFYKNETSQVMIRFLEEQSFASDLNEIRKNATHPKSFQKRFFVWFNAFRVLKLVHFLRDHQFSNKPIFGEAKKMAEAHHFYEGEKNEKALLLSFRTYEKLL